MRRLLIDADIVAYVASSATQQTFDWGEDGGVVTAADLKAAKRTARDTIDEYMSKLDGDELVICLSDDFANFRKEVYPAYKSARTTVERPVHLYDIKAWLAEKYTCSSRPRLEADDVMGILSTQPGHGEERIIVSADKDMQTIPGPLYRPQVGKVVEITEAFADRYHLLQTVTGDATDGYPGCPGAGPKAAEAALNCMGVRKVTREITKGPRKGVEVVSWEPDECETQWQAIVSLYWKAGLTERDAIVQARCARILRHSDYDGRRPILWNPPR